MVYQLIHDQSSSGVRDNLVETDGDYNKVTIADMTPDGGKKISNTQFKVGRAIKPDHLPTRLKRDHKRSDPLEDYMPAAKGASYVSTAFKALVEQFEPGVHQFFEMAVKSGKRDAGIVYYFVVTNRIDALDHAACVPPIGPNDRLYTPNYDPDDKIVFSKSQIGSAHIWSEKRELGIFMTDAFHDALFANGLTGAKDSVHFEETP